MNIPQSAKYDLRKIESQRIARNCICCGGANLHASPAIMMPFISHRVFGWAPTQIDETWGIRSIKKGMAYAICNSLMCEDCSLLFMDLRFSDDELERLYKDYRGADYNRMREFYEPDYKARGEAFAFSVPYLKDTEEFILQYISNPSTVLDWGGDTGLNTPLKNSAAEVVIYDISAKPADGGLQTDDKNRLAARSFDLICCMNVLEHVPFPSRVIREIKSFMDVGRSVLFIEVPFETLCFTKARNEQLPSKRHWHEHINFYSESSLKCLLENSGMELVAFRCIETGGTGNQAKVFQLLCKRVA